MVETDELYNIGTWSGAIDGWNHCRRIPGLEADSGTINFRYVMLFSYILGINQPRF